MNNIAFGLFLILAMLILTWTAFGLARIVTYALLGPCPRPPGWSTNLVILLVLIVWLGAATWIFGLAWYPQAGAFFSAALGARLWEDWWR